MSEHAGTRVGVVGLGYVGLPLALALVSAGYDAVGVDIAEDQVTQLQAGESYIKDIADEEVENALATEFKPTIGTSQPV